MSNGFVINFDDPDDVRRGFAEATNQVSVLEDRLAEVRALEKALEKWRARRDFLATQLPEDGDELPKTPQTVRISPAVEHDEAMPITPLVGANTGIGELALEVLEEAG